MPLALLLRRGGGDQWGEGQSERVGCGLEAEWLAFHSWGAEGIPRSERLEFQPDGSVQLGVVVQEGGVQVGPGHVGPSQIRVGQVRPL